MTQVNNYSQNIPITNGYQTPVSQNPVATPQVNVTTPQGVTPIYQYPTTSLYNPNSKQAASGVNIIINNPAGMSTGCPCNCHGGQMVYPGATTINNNNNNTTPQAQIPDPAAQTPISQEKSSTTNADTTTNVDTTKNEKDKKNTVVVDDNYVRNIESYLRSPDEEQRKNGIIDLIKRFEEDESRYEHPALTALLNIALQDASPNNKMLAMTPIATESAHGDENTSRILREYIESENAKQTMTPKKPLELNGLVLKTANEALLKTSIRKEQ